MSTPDPFILKREADSDPFTVQIGDTSLTMPHVNDVDPFEVAALYNSDQKSDVSWLIGFFTVVMGEDVEQLRALKLKRSELLAIYTAYLAHAGTSEGESPASSD